MTLVDRPPTGGGAERVAAEIAIGLDPGRYERTLCLSRSSRDEPGASSVRSELESAGVRLLALDRRGAHSLAAWAPLMALLRGGGVDVLHAHKFGSNVWGSLLGRLAGVPVVVAHEHTWSYEGQRLRRILDRHVVARLSDVFLAVSSEDRRRMVAVERIPPERVVLVPNGIRAAAGSGRDVRAELGLDRRAEVVGAVAVQRPQKGLDVLIRAAAILAARRPRLRVLLIGGGAGDEPRRLAALAGELALDGVVTFLGSRADVPDVLRGLDVAVNASRFEGSPLAVMEYMAAGLPIVATRVGGVPDLVCDGREGLLVEPDDPDALAAAIDRLLDDRALAARLGAAASRRQAAELTAEAMVGRVERIYATLLARRGRGLRLEHIAGGIAALRPAWDELAEASRNPFSTPEWVEAWCRHLGGGRPPLLLGCRRPDGSLAAIFALDLARRGPLRVARLAGHGPADELGPACAPEDRLAALAALRRALRSGMLPVDVLIGDRVAAEEGLGLALDGPVLQREASPSLPLSGTWEELLAARSRNFREQVRRRERSLARDHALRFRLTRDPAELDADLGSLFRLHEARWGERGTGPFRGPTAAFHREFAASALARGWLRLWHLELDGIAVAAWYGWRYGGLELYYQSGRDPGWERRSIGFVLLVHTIREALGDRMSEYRFLRGGESYKGRFATDDRPVETRAVGRGPIARGAVAGARLASGRGGAPRRALKRLAG